MFNVVRLACAAEGKYIFFDAHVRTKRVCIVIHTSSHTSVVCTRTDALSDAEYTYKLKKNKQR